MRADCASTRSRLLPSGAIPMGRTVPGGAARHRSWRGSGRGSFDQHAVRLVSEPPSRSRSCAGRRTAAAQDVDEILTAALQRPISGCSADQADARASGHRRGAIGDAQRLLGARHGSRSQRRLIQLPSIGKGCCWCCAENCRLPHVLLDFGPVSRRYPVPGAGCRHSWDDPERAQRSPMTQRSPGRETAGTSVF